MAKYGSNSLKVEFDNSAGTLVDISQYVLTINGVRVEAILQESHSFGDAWFESLATGLRRMTKVTIGGLYDDATGGPDDVFKGVPSAPSDATRTLKITWGGTKTTQVETYIESYDRKPTRGELHSYEAVLQPVGAVTET